MKHYQFLAICTTALLLSACGGGSGGNFTTPNNNNLGQNYTVPNHLKDAVREAMTYPVYWDPAPGRSALTLGNKTYNKGDSLDFTIFPLGYSEESGSISISGEVNTIGKFRIYRLPYSIITAETITDIELASNSNYNRFGVGYGTAFYLGYPTQSLPQTGKATYVGKSFYNEETGDFNMTVDFADKKVTDGSITGLTTGNITLKEGNIQPVEYADRTRIGFKGEAVLANGKAIEPHVSIDKNGKDFNTTEYNSSYYNFEYSGHFFGPNAEEAAGLIEAKGKTNPNDAAELINFAGQRGEIK